MARIPAHSNYLAAAVLGIALAGCADHPAPTAPAPAESAPAADKPVSKVEAQRAKLAPEDRALVEAQEWCAISTDERLGSMGPPIKLDIKGQPVFICCKGCRRKAEADPEKTLASVAELKAKAAAEKTAHQ